MAFKVHPMFTGPQGVKLAAIVGGGSLIAYLAYIGIKKDAEKQKSPGSISGEALSTVNAATEKSKGSPPNASKWA